MHVNAKRIAFLGLLLAVTILLIFLGGTMEMSTLFFLAGAAFCVGIVVREYGNAMGASFLIASIILGLFLVPNKLYCITFAAMALYLLLSEIAWGILCRHKSNGNGMKLFWIIRYMIFNILYLPILFLFPQMIISVAITPYFFLIAIVAGQIVLYLFEKGYCFFQARIWNRFRKYLNS